MISLEVSNITRYFPSSPYSDQSLFLLDKQRGLQTTVAARSPHKVGLLAVKPFNLTIIARCNELLVESLVYAKENLSDWSVQPLLRELLVCAIFSYCYESTCRVDGAKSWHPQGMGWHPLLRGPRPWPMGPCCTRSR
jgi:hypothetical protein